MIAKLRLTLVLLWVLVTFSYRLVGLLFLPVSKRTNEFFRKSAFRACAKGILAITGIRLRIEGTPPKTPFYLVSNHISFFDVFIIASELGCVFVSKSELGQWPVFGFIADKMSTILINREDIRDTRRVNEEIKRIVSNGLGIAVFPESKVSQTGDLLPFKTALLEPAVEMNMTVQYASVHYATPHQPEAARELILWRDGVSFIQHFLNVASLPNCEAKLRFGEGAIQSTDRKQLAQELHNAVKAQHEIIR